MAVATLSTLAIAIFLTSTTVSAQTAGSDCNGYVYLTPENKFVYTNSSNGNNISVTEGAANCYQIKSAVQNMLIGQRMNHNETQNLQNFIAQQQRTNEKLSSYYQNPSVNESKQMQEMEPKIAFEQRMEQEKERANYIAETTDPKLKSLEHAMTTIHQQRININQINESQDMNPWTSNWSMNPIQNYTNNHNVNVPASVHYIPPLKPEFAKFPTGWDRMNSTITNWNQLEQYMINHNSTSFVVNGTK